MIRLIREGSQKYPWILKFIVLGIAITFTIGMGWFGFDQAQQPNAVAVIGPYHVTLQEFRRTYERTRQFYRNQLKQEEMDETALKSMVIGGLIDGKAWTLTADTFQLDIAPEELKRAIQNRKEFQKDGKFDPKLYHRLLADNKFSPQQFESQLRTDLLSEKAQMIVQDTTTLTPSELKEVDSLASRQSAGKEDEAEIAKIRERIRLQFLFQKKQRALQAFQAAMRASTDVEIREEFL